MYLLLIWSGNINGLLIPSSSPHRFHERNLHICKDVWKNIEVPHSYDKSSNLSYYWILCHTSIIWWFSRFSNVSYQRGRVALDLVAKFSISLVRVVTLLWGHVHTLYTKCKPKGVLISSNIILEGSSLIICPTPSLYMSFINCGFYDQNWYLTIHKALHKNNWS
jgi:hypothetical protein